MVVRIAELYYNKEDGDSYDFDIITPYDAQRRLVEKKLKSKGIQKEVYNLDSFQVGPSRLTIFHTLTSVGKGARKRLYHHNTHENDFLKLPDLG